MLRVPVWSCELADDKFCVDLFGILSYHAYLEHPNGILHLDNRLFSFVDTERSHKTAQTVTIDVGILFL